MRIDKEIQKQLLIFQKNEKTEYHIYMKLARKVQCPENRKILKSIAEDELKHYEFWRTLTQSDVKPNQWKIGIYYLISRIFGFTFGIKLMENGEGDAQDNYQQLVTLFPEVKNIVQDENDHEETLIRLLDEERLRYIGSIVLGLNDALVELTGALAGLTLALQNTQLIALTGLITGIAAALSMAASEYLSTKSEDTAQNPMKASIYTGSAYVMTVIILILPYLIFDNYYLCLALTLTAAILIIAFFNYYISVAKEVPFKNRFLEMAGLSLSVAILSFFIGYLIRMFLGVDV
ncbi:VIT1/CCC1 transporter family protein [bacterium]|nr:VIT1/CCC1 transporter family protein [bacterium]RQV92084.1 MAG: rubrerythrin family protein [bacterium]